jgi:hypothetical protein
MKWSFCDSYRAACVGRIVNSGGLMGWACRQKEGKKGYLHNFGGETYRKVAMCNILMEDGV